VDVTLLTPVLKGYEGWVIILDCDEFSIPTLKSDGPGPWRVLNWSGQAVQGFKPIHQRWVKCYTDFGFVFIRFAA
jgi:hypothetical protein